MDAKQNWHHLVEQACDFCNGEHEADADIVAGRVHRFANAEDCIVWLRSEEG